MDPVLIGAMRRAVAVSSQVVGTTSPNPPVGAVALGADDAVISVGATEPPGGRHAEVVALEAAPGPVHTVVVTLEPCDHTGRTGPCTSALLAAGVQRVVVACAEPTALAGGGVARLRAAGVEVVTGVLEDEVASGPLAPWLHRQRTGRPFVTWKTATTLDGRVAASDGTSRWITGEAARADVHAFRSQVDAVLVGSGTVLADDPQLTVRPDPGRQPLRVVLDRAGRVPAGARVLDGSAATLHLTDVPSLEQVLADLAARGVVHLLLEGGPTLTAAFVTAGLVDEIRAYVAPALLGAGPGAVGDLGITSVDDALRWLLHDVTRFGEDVRLVLRPRQA